MAHYSKAVPGPLEVIMQDVKNLTQTQHDSMSVLGSN